jgi:hypothetical protein
VVSSRGEQGAVAVAAAAGAQLWGRWRQHPACTSAWTARPARRFSLSDFGFLYPLVPRPPTSATRTGCPPFLFSLIASALTAGSSGDRPAAP